MSWLLACCSSTSRWKIVGNCLSWKLLAFLCHCHWWQVKLSTLELSSIFRAIALNVVAHFSSAQLGTVWFTLLFSLSSILLRFFSSLSAESIIHWHAPKAFDGFCDRPIEFINPLCAASKLAARYAQQKNEGKVEAQKSYSWLFSGRGKWSSCTHTHTVAGKMRLNLAWKLTRHLWHNDNYSNKKKLAGKLKRAKAQQQRKKGAAKEVAD